MEFLSPTNGTECTFEIHEERIATAHGRLASKRSRLITKPGDTGDISETTSDRSALQASSSKSRVAGFLVTRDFKDMLIAPDELAEFTQLSTTVVEQQLHIPFHSNFDRLKLCIGKLFDDVKELEWINVSERVHGLCIHDTITLTHTYPPGNVLVQWDASPKSDMMADAVVALLMQAEGGIAGIRMKPWCAEGDEGDGHNHSHCNGHSHDQRELEHASRKDLLRLVEELIREYYGKDNVVFEKVSAKAGEGEEGDRRAAVTIKRLAHPTCRAVVNVDGGAVETCEMASKGEDQGEEGESAAAVARVLGRLLSRAVQVSRPIKI